MGLYAARDECVVKGGQPVEGGGDRIDRRDRWGWRAGDHDDRQGEVARGGEFGCGGGGAGVFGDQDLDAVRAQQGAFAGLVERPARGDDGGIGRAEFGRWGVDAADQIMMSGCGAERSEFLLADGEEDPAGRGADGGGGFCRGGNQGPVIGFGGVPGGAVDAEEWGGRGGGGLCGVGRDLGGEGVGGVDHGIDRVVAEIGGEAGCAAEAADAVGDGWQDRGGGAAGEREDRGVARIGFEGAGEGRGFAAAAEDQEIEFSGLGHGVVGCMG